MDGIDKTGGAGNAASLRPTPVAAPTPAVPARQAQLSSTSEAFALLADAAPADTRKIEAIRSMIAAGAYPIDAQTVAAKMIALDFPAHGDPADA